MRLWCLSTPSLGITSHGKRWLSGGTPKPFNSLSRDHGLRQEFLGWRLIVAFQLPLSGSPRIYGEAGEPAVGLCFQLPLSGSRAPHDVELFPLPRRREESFKSLSRDHVWSFTSEAGRLRGTFNSLSRDHRARFRDFQALRGVLPRHLFAQMISKTTIWIYRSAPL